MGTPEYELQLSSSVWTQVRQCCPACVYWTAYVPRDNNFLLTFQRDVDCERVHSRRYAADYVEKEKQHHRF